MGHQSPDLEQWQVNALTGLRRLRPKGFDYFFLSTRSSKGELITETQNYWGRVTPGADGKFSFVIYSKVSGNVERTGSELSEEKAQERVTELFAGPKEPS